MRTSIALRCRSLSAEARHASGEVKSMPEWTQGTGGLPGVMCTSRIVPGRNMGTCLLTFRPPQQPARLLCPQKRRQQARTTPSACPSSSRGAGCRAEITAKTRPAAHPCPVPAAPGVRAAELKQPRKMRNTFLCSPCVCSRSSSDAGCSAQAREVSIWRCSDFSSIMSQPAVAVSRLRHIQRCAAEGASREQGAGHMFLPGFPFSQTGGGVT